MNSSLEYFKLIFLDLNSGFQYSSKKSNDFPAPIEVIKILMTWVIISILVITIYNFIIGLFKPPFKLSEFLPLDIFISVLILFKISLKKGYSLKKVFKLEILQFKLLFPIVLIGIALSITMSELEYLIRYTIELFSYVNIMPIEETKQLADMNQWIYFLYVVISVPILEELIFRGMLLTSIEYSNGIIKAVFYTSLVFAVTHIYLSNVLAIFITSVVIAIVVLRTGSVVSAIILHVINNALSFYFFRIIKLHEYSELFSFSISSIFARSILMLFISVILLTMGFIWFSYIINHKMDSHS